MSTPQPANNAQTSPQSASDGELPTMSDTPEDCTIHGSVTAPVPTCEPEYADYIKPAATKTPRINSWWNSYRSGAISPQEFKEAVQGLERELAEANRRSEFLQSQHDKIVGELAEARAEASVITTRHANVTDANNSLRTQPKDMTDQFFKASGELSARDGVIARLKEAGTALLGAMTINPNIIVGDCFDERNALSKVIALTPATYADALAKAEQRIVNLEHSNEAHRQMAEKWRAGACESQALRAELSELRGLLEKAVTGLDINYCVGGEHDIETRIRARLARKENQ